MRNIAATSFAPLLALVALLLDPGALMAKDCLIPYSIYLKRMDGALSLVGQVLPTSSSAISLTATLYLAPGDSILVDLDPNNYCYGYQPPMTIRQGCGDGIGEQGPILHVLAGSYPHRFVFRSFGDLRLDIEDYFQYSGVACLTVVESAVGVEEAGHSAGLFQPYLAEGVLNLGEHPQGELALFDARGSLLLVRNIGPNEPSIPLPTNATALVTVILTTANGRSAQRLIVIQ
ncbi:MAG: hypothetical protein ABI432_08160 [Flavobacteriales bacterium]